MNEASLNRKEVRFNVLITDGSKTVTTKAHKYKESGYDSWFMILIRLMMININISLEIH